MHDVHPNSLFSYLNVVQPELTKRQQEVLSVFSDGLGHTDTEVAGRLGLEINQVTGRIGELIKKGKLYEAGRIEKDGRRRRVCKLK